MKMLKAILCCLFLLFSTGAYSQCILADNISALPLPVGGVYTPGQVVTFTYNITNYQGLSVNWMHGIVPSLGPGWLPGSLSPIGNPTNNNGNGAWVWVNSVTSSATGSTVNGPGWFYDSPSGGPGVLDGNPGNNWGDGLTGPWTFRWSATVGNCPPNANGASLQMVIFNYGDGETGSWINYDCAQDPNETFNATLQCCVPYAIGPISHN